MKMKAIAWLGGGASLLLSGCLLAAESTPVTFSSALLPRARLPTTEFAQPLPPSSLTFGWLLQATEPTQTAANSPLIYGWIETIRLQPEGVALEAKLDTGADTSSLDARDITLFSRDGEKWVRFSVEGQPHGVGGTQVVERPVLRRIKVRGAGGVDHRVVVQMRVCVGQLELDEQFSLRDRRDMEYPVLLGRRTLARLGPVDVTHTHMHTASCAD